MDDARQKFQDLLRELFQFDCARKYADQTASRESYAAAHVLFVEEGKDGYLGRIFAARDERVMCLRG